MRVANFEFEPIRQVWRLLEQLFCSVCQNTRKHGWYSNNSCKVIHENNITAILDGKQQWNALIIKTLLLDYNDLIKLII